MKEFTAFEYLLINIANSFGKDKGLFEEGIQWTKDNLKDLKTLANNAGDDRIAALKSIKVLDDAIKTGKTNAMVHLDATCSGIQLMSALTNCIAGARATGLIDPERRADCYTDVLNAMNRILNGKIKVARPDIKMAIMTAGYGSEAQPKKLFPDNLDEFYASCREVAPKAFQLQEALVATWNPTAEEHFWILPDGFNAHIAVTNKFTHRYEVEELGGCSAEISVKIKAPSDYGKANVAN